MLSLNCEYTFLLLNFLITGLWSSSANIKERSFTKPIPIDFLSKNLCTILAKPL